MLPNSLLSVFMVLESVGDENYIVGGAVRDHLLGETPHDFDVVTGTDINVVAKAFADAGWETIETGMNFLVLNIAKELPVPVETPYGTVYESETARFEIAQFRTDSNYNGRHCDVEAGDIFGDANRRDFTINALYMNPFTGDIVDPTGQGIDDIESRTLRFIGKPEDRLNEDMLRVWRFLRFTKKGFTANKKDAKAVKRLFKQAYESSNPARVLSEILKYHDL